jgi:hypothetical protein
MEFLIMGRGRSGELADKKRDSVRRKKGLYLELFLSFTSSEEEGK